MPRRTRKILFQYASMWPREVCDLHDKDKRRLFIRDSPDLRQPGVYVLYRDDHPYYIGKALRLGKRIWEHANHPFDRRYNFWNMFSAFVVSDKKYLNDVEGILIAAIPTGNNSTPRIPKVRLPSYVVQQLKQIQRHQANPVTRREFESIMRALRRSVRPTRRGRLKRRSASLVR
jgi:hypothetical protein